MNQKIALIDIDGTLADYTSAMERDLRKIRSPEETGPLMFNHSSEDEPKFYTNRVHLIRGQKNWWLDLDIHQPGCKLYDAVCEIGFTPHILTKGPRSNPTAFTEKVEWVQKRFGYDVRVTLSGDKGLVYGRVLIDDYPPYVEAWLKHRPRGLAVLPDQPWNKGFTHPNAVVATENNFGDVCGLLEEAFKRE